MFIHITFKFEKNENFTNFFFYLKKNIIKKKF